MIKVVRANREGRKLLILGLSELNVQKLKDDKPIVIEGGEFGDLDPQVDVLLCYGTTETDVTAKLEQHGLVPAGSAKKAAEVPETESRVFKAEDF